MSQRPPRYRLLLTSCLAAMVTVTLGACAGDGDAGSAEGVRTTVDSTGPVLRVHNEGSAAALPLEPVYAVGEQGGLEGGSAEEFGRIQSVLLGPDGELYVGDGHSAQITVFDSTGELLRVMGRRGGGPGEIERLWDMAWIGDTLVVMDSENGRLTKLGREGEYAGEWPFMRASGSGVRLHNAGIDQLYSFAIRLSREAGAGGGGSAESVWARFGRAGAIDTIPRPLPGRTAPEGSFEMCRGQGGLSVYQNPLGETTLVRPAPDGMQAVASTSRYRVALVGPDGDTVRTLSRDVAPPPLTDGEWRPVATAHAEWKEDWKGAECEGSVSRPAHGPLLLGLHYDEAGRLIVEYAGEGGPVLDLYDRDGRWTAQVPFIERNRSADPAFRDGRVAVVRLDSLDVPRVEVFRIAGSADSWRRGVADLPTT